METTTKENSKTRIKRALEAAVTPLTAMEIATPIGLSLESTKAILRQMRADGLVRSMRASLTQRYVRSNPLVHELVR